MLKENISAITLADLMAARHADPAVANQPQPAAGAIHDYSPVVSVDIRYADRYAAVEFDYAAFDREAERLGMSLEDRGQLAITAMPVRGQQRGGYNPKQKEIWAGSNRNLIHELSHAADHAHGVVHMGIRYQSGKFAAAALPFVVLPDIALVTCNVVEDQPGFGPTLGVSLLVGGIALAADWGYWRHPMERQAYAAERSSTEVILRMTKR